ncbi:MAG: nucleotide sugar dehydrogenase, partial [Frankiaceae bacterium]
MSSAIASEYGGNATAVESDTIGIAEPATGFLTVAVLGMGYVGLPTALALVAAGHAVLGLDVSEQRLADIRDCRVDLVPADLDRLREAITLPTFVLASDTSLISKADAVIVCVPTPIDSHLMPDLSPLAGACRTVVDKARPGQTIVLTSTTYVGTTRDLLVDPLAERGLEAGTDVHVAFSPERIDPGNTTHPQATVPRVVGGVTGGCARRAGALLGSIAANIHLVSAPETAEMTKLVENTFRAVNIALANEFADIGRVLGLEVMEVINAAATKPYGFVPFLPGPGVGGHCIPCDPHYLLWQLRRDRVQTPVVEQAMVAIAQRPLRVVDRVREVLSDNGLSLRGARVLVVGVTYKPGVEDVRESPAIEILSRLRQAGCEADFWDELAPVMRLTDGSI